MKTSYGYMVIDLNPQSNPKHRIRTQIFPGEYPIIYLAPAVTETEVAMDSASVFFLPLFCL